MRSQYQNNYNTHQLQYKTPRTPYISKLFEKGLKSIQTWAIVPAEDQIQNADVIL